MKELIKKDNRTVIIVSHNLDTLKKLCDRVIWLHDGKVRMDGAADEVLPVYDEFMS